MPTPLFKPPPNIADWNPQDRKQELRTWKDADCSPEAKQRQLEHTAQQAAECQKALDEIATMLTHIIPFRAGKCDVQSWGVGYAHLKFDLCIKVFPDNQQATKKTICDSLRKVLEGIENGQ